MEVDQKIYEKIGKALWFVMPDVACEIYFYGMIFPGASSYSLTFRLKSNGSISWFNFEESPDEIMNQALEDAKKLKTSEPFKKEIWTHFKATLTDSGEFKMEFSYIPEDDSWPGLFMRRVSELSLNEARENYIPKEDWEKCVDKFGKKTNTKKD